MHNYLLKIKERIFHLIQYRKASLCFQCMFHQFINCLHYLLTSSIPVHPVTPIDCIKSSKTTNNATQKSITSTVVYQTIPTPKCRINLKHVSSVSLLLRLGGCRRCRRRFGLHQEHRMLPTTVHLQHSFVLRLRTNNLLRQITVLVVAMSQLVVATHAPREQLAVHRDGERCAVATADQRRLLLQSLHLSQLDHVL